MKKLPPRGKDSFASHRSGSYVSGDIRCMSSAEFCHKENENWSSWAQAPRRCTCKGNEIIILGRCKKVAIHPTPNPIS